MGEETRGPENFRNDNVYNLYPSEILLGLLNEELWED